MKKLDRLKLVREFGSIRQKIKEKLSPREINEEIAEVRRLKRERDRR